MNRRDFGLWGIELSPGEFAQALAALGVLGGLGFWPGTPSTDPELDRSLEQAFQEANRPLQWRMVWHPSFGPPGPSCRALADAWQRSLERFGKPRLEVNRYPLQEALWIVEELSRAEVGAASVYIQIEDDLEVAVGWQWPLRVGLLPGPASAGLRGELEAVQEGNWAGRLAQLVELGGVEESCDLLLLPLDLPAALVEVLTFPGSLRADCVLVLGRAGAPAERLTPLLEALRTQVRTAGVGLATVPSGSQGRWFKALLRELSHNFTLDVALAAARRKIEAQAPFLLASRRLVEFHLSDRVRQMAESFFESVGETTVEIPLGSAFEKNLSMTGRYRLRDIGEQLRSVPDDPFTYTHETDMASVAAEASELARGAREEMAPEPPQERFLQAQVFDAGREGRRLVRAWRAGAPHAVAVRVGAPDEEWLAPDPLSPFPAQELPPEQAEHRLTVVFSEPFLLSEPQITEIVLPRRGNSSLCTFFLHVKEGTERVEARVIVLHANRVLQTALLRGPVAAEPEEAEGPGIELAVEAVVRPGLADLDNRRRFDASLVLNHDSRSMPRVTKIAEQRAEVVTHQNLQKEIDWFNGQLTQIAYNRSSFSGGLTADATVDLLRSFAQHGSLLYRYIVRDLLGDDPLVKGERLQIISTEPDAAIPVEFLYARKAPVDGAGLCPNAAESLRAGRCGDSCPQGAEEKNVICPLGFWGMSKVLERHLHVPEFSQKLRGTFAFQAEPLKDRSTLPVLGDSLVANSYRVDESCKGGMDGLRQKIQEVTRRAPESVSTWDDWAHKIAGGTPTLLALLVHTDRVAPGDHMQKMEIGKDSWLSVANVDETYVRDRLEKPPPLVMLLGCETSAPEVSFLSLVGQFRASGAAIVLSTGSAVHSVHAVPVARRYVEILARLIGKGETTFGEVMRTARRELLADGYPMVLCLAAYGDADWRLV
jgi:hypothetical protein